MLLGVCLRMVLSLGTHSISQTHREAQIFLPYVDDIRPEIKPSPQKNQIKNYKTTLSILLYNVPILVSSQTTFPAQVVRHKAFLTKCTIR